MCEEDAAIPFVVVYTMSDVMLGIYALFQLFALEFTSKCKSIGSLEIPLPTCSKTAMI